MNKSISYNLADKIRKVLKTYSDDVQSTLHNKSDQDCDSKKLAVRLKDFEKSCIIEALTEANYKIADAAEILSIERTNLHKKIKSHNIDMSLLRKDKTS